MTAPDLKPCPFCGGVPELYEWLCANSPRMLAQVRCDCGVEGTQRSADNRLGHFDAENGLHRNEAIAAWNRRDPAVLAADEIVQAMIGAAVNLCSSLAQDYAEDPNCIADRGEFWAQQISEAILEVRPDSTAALERALQRAREDKISLVREKSRALHDELAMCQTLSRAQAIAQELRELFK
jgi:Restriction alleviation protein Lar